jgi:multiple sugar transport system substrate-binding protein
MIKKTFKFLLTATLVAATSFGYVGCSDGNSGASASESDASVTSGTSAAYDIDTNTTATMQIAVKNDVTEIAAMQQVIAGFNEIYPNVKFNLAPITDYEATIMGNVAAGIVYDVMWVADSYVTLFADSDLLENLDTYIDDTGFDTSLYYDSLIHLGQYKHNGSQYFLPRDSSKIVVYLNKAIFNQYNVAIPDNDWTWEDYKSICQQLYDAGCNYTQNGQYVMEAEFDWRIQMYGITSSYGGVFLDENGSPVFDSNFQAGLTEMQSLIKNGYAKFATTEQQNFVSGRVAMRWQVRPAAMSYYATLKDDLAVVAFPSIQSGIDGTSPSCGTGTTGYGICKSSKQKKLAWKFLEYMMSEQGQEKLSDSGLVVPSLKSLAESETASWRSVFPNLNSDAFIYNGTTDVIPDYYDTLDSVYMSGYDAAVVKMLHTIFGDTSKSIKAQIATCKQEIQTFIRQQG